MKSKGEVGAPWDDWSSPPDETFKLKLPSGGFCLCHEARGTKQEAGSGGIRPEARSKHGAWRRA